VSSGSTIIFYKNISNYKTYLQNNQLGILILAGEKKIRIGETWFDNRASFVIFRDTLEQFMTIQKSGEAN